MRIMLKIRNRRKLKGYTQQQVAAALGIKSEYYSRMETGVVSPSIDKVEAVAEAIGCKLVLVDKD